MKNLKKILVISFGVLMLFTAKATFAATPTLIVDPASNITTNSATFSAFYNMNGETATGAFFKYGTDPLMSQTTYVTTPTLLTGNMATSVTGLLPNTTYYYKIVLVSTAGITESVGVPFTTLGAASGSCVINSFTSSQSNVTAGSSVVLAWTTTGCNSVTVGGIMSSILASSSTTTVVNATTTYTLTAYGSNNNATASVTVTVGTNPNACNLTVSASPSTIALGGSSVLSWASTNCNGVVLSYPGVSSLGVSGSGTYTVTPTTTTTYTLSAYNTNNTLVSKSVTVTVGTTGGACTVNLTASQYTAYANTPVTLYWTSSGCTYLNFGQVGGGTYPTSGSVPVTVNQTSTFTIYAYGTSNNDTKTITITVVNAECNGYNCNPPDKGCAWYNNCTNRASVTCDSCGPVDRFATLSYASFGIDNTIHSETNRDRIAYNATTVPQASQAVSSVPQIIMMQAPANNTTPKSTGNTYITYAAPRNNNNSNTTNPNQVAGDQALVPPMGTVVDTNSNLAAGAGWSIGSFFPSTLIGWLLFIIFILIIVMIARSFSKKNAKDAHGAHH